jgi:hypothetical protein
MLGEIVIALVVGVVSYCINRYCTCYSEIKEELAEKKSEFPHTKDSSSSIESYEKAEVDLSSNKVTFSGIYVRRDSELSTYSDNAEAAYNGQAIWWLALKETFRPVKEFFVGSKKSSGEAKPSELGDDVFDNTNPEDNATLMGATDDGKDDAAAAA